MTRKNFRRLWACRRDEAACHLTFSEAQIALLCKIIERSYAHPHEEETLHPVMLVLTSALDIAQNRSRREREGKTKP